MLLVMVHILGVFLIAKADIDIASPWRKTVYRTVYADFCHIFLPFLVLMCHVFYQSWFEIELVWNRVGFQDL